MNQIVALKPQNMNRLRYLQRERGNDFYGEVRRPEKTFSSERVDPVQGEAGSSSVRTQVVEMTLKDSFGIPENPFEAAFRQDEEDEDNSDLPSQRHRAEYEDEDRGLKIRNAAERVQRILAKYDDHKCPFFVAKKSNAEICRTTLTSTVD